MAKEIRFFKRDREAFPFLSNFFPVKLKGDGIVWPSGEHYYQALKIDGWYDSTENHNLLKTIQEAKTAGKAKKLGKMVKLRPNWERKKEFYMMKVLRAKFGQNKNIAEALLDTGTAVLLEDSPHDYCWGIGSDGSGKNRLGELLMELRKDLKKRSFQQGYGTIRCLLCGDVIQSIHVHDFRYCFCGAIAVDGGRDYLKISGQEGDYEVLVVGKR